MQSFQGILRCLLPPRASALPGSTTATGNAHFCGYIRGVVRSFRLLHRVPPQHISDSYRSFLRFRLVRLVSFLVFWVVACAVQNRAGSDWNFARCMTTFETTYKLSTRCGHARPSDRCDRQSRRTSCVRPHDDNRPLNVISLTDVLRHVCAPHPYLRTVYVSGLPLCAFRLEHAATLPHVRNWF